MNNKPFDSLRAPLSALIVSVSLTASVATAALTVALFTLVTSVGYAQSNTEGYIYGAGAPAGSAVSAVSLTTGQKRDAVVDASGNYRISSLPVGDYKVTLKAKGQPDQVVESVSVNLGTGSSVRFGAKSDVISLEKFSVSAGSVSPIDVSSVESVTVFNQQVIKQLPVARNTTAVALLAPGTTQGVAAFGNLASFGGSSVGENAYYVNGFNLTNARNGLGGASVPFEFYDQFQVKTGGYGAEFGRSTGGVINTTTKRGGNTFKAGANIYYEPEQLASRSPSVNQPNGSPYINRSRSDSSSLNANVYASGALIKNKLFFYGLYNARDNKSEGAGISTYSRSRSKDPFYGTKLDWNVSDNHSFEFTAISDKRKTETETLGYTYATGAIGASNGSSEAKRGGKDYIFRYSGKLTEDFNLSALYGKSAANFTDAGAGDSIPYVLDARSGTAILISKATTAQPTTLEDTRKAMRIDGDYSFKFSGTHQLRFGLDREDNTSNSLVAYSGGVYWRYVVTAPGKTLANGGIVPAGVTEYARKRIYANGGAFQTLTNAYYAEDNWKLLDDQLLLSLGLRNEGFDNRNSEGATFVKINNQLAPRLGASFDVEKNGKSKIFANYGRYYLPIATNTNIRLAGGETYYEEYYALTGLKADSTPNIGAQIGGRNVFSAGEIRNPLEIVDRNIKPMYQDEYILGYQRQVNKDWTVGVRGTYRNVGRFIEDEAIDETLNAYAAKNNIKGFAAGGNDYYVLTNPGQPMTTFVDFGDGKGLRAVSFTPAELKFPKAKREYVGAEVFFEKAYNGKWMLQGSYTHSYSWGNDEGSVLSDNGQTDAGLTVLFDHPGLMDHSTGYLANDRRHKFKLFGAYNLTKEFQLGGNFRLESGTPKNALGFHPTDLFASQYGAASFFSNSKPTPRGSAGRTPWNNQIDLTLKYRPRWAADKLGFGLDVFNALNLHTATEYNNVAETGLNVSSPTYNLPTSFQTSRYVRISVSYDY
jgi:Carboxypeptidase regulatory-like domain